MDLVYGAVSGIPPEDIKNYIEQTKGAGGTSIPTGYVRDPNASNYVKIKQLNQLTPKRMQRLLFYTNE